MLPQKVVTHLDLSGESKNQRQRQKANAQQNAADQA